MRTGKTIFLVLIIYLSYNIYFPIRTAWSKIDGDQVLTSAYNYTEYDTNTSAQTPSNDSTDNENELKIDALSAIAIDADNRRVLFEKKAYEKRAIASTTKIMTAILAIEYGKLEEDIKVSERAARINGSVIHLKKGEKLKLRELLYGMLLNSGNDAAIAIAEHIGGSVEEFVCMMNKKALEIGALNTYYKNPHGLDMDGQYSTAYDLAIISAYALEKPQFTDVVKTKSKHITGRILNNTNEMLSRYSGADGVKTGYTGKAGRCLVTSATRNDLRVISVVLNCDSRTKRAQSSEKILNYVFDNYKKYVLIENNKKVKYIPVYKGTLKKIPVVSIDKVTLPLKEEEKKRIKIYVELPEELYPPVFPNIEVGYVSFYLDGEIIGKSPVKTIMGSQKKDFSHYLNEIISEMKKIIM